MNKLALGMLSALLITACEHKEILQGKREEFLQNADAIRINKDTAAMSISMPSAISLKSHVHVGGNEQHNASNYLMPKTFSTAWTRSVGGDIGTDLICNDGKLYAVNSYGDLVCLSSKSGDILWKQNISSHNDGVSFTGGIAFLNDNIFVSTNHGEVIGISSKTRKELFRNSILIPVKSNPVVKNDKLVVTTINNKTYCLSTRNGKNEWVKIGAQEEAVMEKSGTPAIYGNNVICAYTNGDIASVSLATGEEIWSDVLFSANTEDSGFVISHIVASPVVSNGKVLAATSESKMALIDASSGIRIWEQVVGTMNAPVIVGSWVFVITSDGSLMCFSFNDGSAKWSSKIGSDKGKLFGPVIINGNICVFSEHGEMMLFDSNNGKLKKFEDLKIYISGSPIIVDKSMYVVSGSNVVCLR
ncbi:MAG: PQQ-like beta-propeller repeat protein [Holosporales bacterium]|jgi:outer membrane protein assembly factor BamB|nr:PQQ-like beta-propeller repeat protein [Holosporales bacterium]